MMALTVAPDLEALPPRLQRLIQLAMESGWSLQFESLDATQDGWSDGFLFMPWRKTRDGVLTVCLAIARNEDTGRWSVLAAEDSGSRMTAAWADTTDGPIIHRRWDKVRHIHHFLGLTQRSIGQVVDQWKAASTTTRGEQQ